MKHFTFEELEHSAIADALHIDNHANEKVRANLRRLVDEVLDPARELLGMPIDSVALRSIEPLAGQSVRIIFMAVRPT